MSSESPVGYPDQYTPDKVQNKDEDNSPNVNVVNKNSSLQKFRWTNSDLSICFTAAGYWSKQTVVKW